MIRVELESKYRATALSAFSLLSKLPYILGAVVAGVMVQNGLLWLFSLVLGLLIILALLISAIMTKRKEAPAISITE